ncbi:hypothetical protein J7E73_14080 [Paenibacillus albidus]|uniref:hypothetical protein n=1 Tax=Paenibacillus albidus TaxID=2041023 RepID=UPI001BE6633D|nr:hypothetical protein [Paenibacillus albidus]MBT2290249.1 hypothetical protein [Paenibacillus albidus]
MANSRFKKIGLFSTFFVTLTIILTCSYQVYQNVETIHNYFSPKTTSILSFEKETDEWKSIKFDGKDSLSFDSLFWNKKIINTANSEGNVFVRVKNDKGDIVINEFQISPGTGKNLDELIKDQQYFFEVKAERGQFIINAI